MTRAEQTRSKRWLSVKCPTCVAWAGDPCLAIKSGRVLQRPHVRRLDCADLAAAASLLQEETP